MMRKELILFGLLTACSAASVLYQTRETDYCSIVFPVVDDKLQCLKDDIASFINQQNNIIQEMKIKLKVMKQQLCQLEATTAGPLSTTTTTTTTTTTPVPPSITVEVASTQDPSPSTQEPSTSTQEPSTSTQDPSPSTQEPSPSTQEPSPSTQEPSPSTQDPSPSTQEPSTSTQVPKVCTPLSTNFPNGAGLEAVVTHCHMVWKGDNKLPVDGMDLDKNSLPALHWEVLSGNVQCVEALLRAGADHAEKTSGWPQVTALMLAAAIGEEGALCELLVAGADVHAQDNNEYTALHWAARNGQLLSITLLAAAGSNVEARDDDDETALMTASYWEREGAVRALLAAGADVNAQTDESKYSALMMVSQLGYVEIVRALLEGGADKSIKNVNGETALDIAISKGHSQVVQLLRED